VYKIRVTVKFIGTDIFSSCQSVVSFVDGGSVKWTDDAFWLYPTWRKHFQSLPPEWAPKKNIFAILVIWGQSLSFKIMHSAVCGLCFSAYVLSGVNFSSTLIISRRRVCMGLMSSSMALFLFRLHCHHTPNTSKLLSGWRASRKMKLTVEGYQIHSVRCK
jgi:hypothetical protein